MDKLMHTYRVQGGDRCTVGHYTPTGEWIAMEEYPSRSDAAERVHWLNGRIQFNGSSDPHSPAERRSEKGIELRGEARLLRDLEHTTIAEIADDSEAEEFTVTTKENGPPEITCRVVASRESAASRS